MTKRELINGLAHKLSNEVMTTAERNHIFGELLETLHSDIFMIARNYVINKNISNFNISLDDYISNLSYEGMTNALMGYDQNKGDFIARLKVVGKKWMNNQFRTDFAQKSSFCTKAKSLDEMVDVEGFDVPDETNDFTFGIESPVARLIAEFVKSDKDGQVIAILASTDGQSARNSALINFFGKYTATERKRVQRIRERLANYLVSHGVQA